MTLPAPRFDHLRRLTDGVGLFEHADGDVARPEHAYCTDDAARALVLTCRVADPALDDLLERYLALVSSAVAPDGRCHNRLALDGLWQDDAGPGDWWGRAVWGLGVAAARGPEWARGRALAGFLKLAGQRAPWRRAMAYAALGAAELPQLPAARELLADAARLVSTREIAEAPSARGWEWPEARLRYDNARLPEALLAAGTALSRPELQETGLGQLRFLLEIELFDAERILTVAPSNSPGKRGSVFSRR